MTDERVGKFPEPISKLPQADIPLDGVSAYLSQAEDHQIIFMHFEKEVILPEHAHAEQVGFVLDGKIELTIDDDKRVFSRGDRYYIPKGVRHSGRIFAGYSDITFFNEPDRYREKEGGRDEKSRISGHETDDPDAPGTMS